MAKNDTWSWDKHKYKAKEWVKGSWKYIYDTAKKTNDKAKETAKEVSSKVSNIKDTTKENLSKSKEYISNKFETTKDKAEQVINSKLKKDESINATYYKLDEAKYKDTSVIYRYKYTDLVKDLMEENPIPTSIGIGLSILTGTTLPIALGIGIADSIIDNQNRKNKSQAYIQARDEAYEIQTTIDNANREEFEETASPEIMDVIKNMNSEKYKELSDLEKEIIKRLYPFEYSVLEAKSDDRQSQNIGLSDKEKMEKQEANNPGFWAELDNYFNSYDENCWICTVAYGEQLKGNDVYPDDEKDENGATYLMYNDDIEGLYDDPKVINFWRDSNYKNNVRRMTAQNEAYTEEEAKNIISIMEDTYPEGSNGNFLVWWDEQSGGHSMVWEINNGELIIRDTQIDAIYYSESSKNTSNIHNLSGDPSDPSTIDTIEELLEISEFCSVFRSDNIDLKSSADKYLRDKPSHKVTNQTVQYWKYMADHSYDYY